MAEALVSFVVEQLGSIMVRELEQEVRLVVGVEKEVEKLTSNLTAIQAVIADAETKQVKEAPIQDWLEKLKDVAYDIEDVLDDWEAAILCKPGRKVCSFFRSSCFCCKRVGLRHDIANKIKVLNERLDRIAQEKEHYHFVPKEGNPTIERLMTTSMIDITEVKGRDEDKSVLMNMLLSDGDKPDLRVISLIGMGGIGKTTLAQFAFNDSRINDCFEKKIWVCVSDPFDEIRVAKTILESLSGSTPSVIELESLLQKIVESIKKKKFLLVLDDVWEENSGKWEQLKKSLSYGLPGSKVLVTTRKDIVALVMGCSKVDVLKVGNLSDRECWSIVSKIAFFDRSDTECKYLEKRFEREISKKCQGLPLAAKALGGILRFRETMEEWQSILESDIWKLEEAQSNIIVPLWLSYYDLSPVLKRCFSYCAIFPKDHQIEKKKLIELWMAQGYLKQRQRDDLEIIGDYCFRNLTMRSFFQDFKKDKFDHHIISCKMHDIVHDLAQSVGRNECLGVHVNSSAESIIGSLSSKMHHLSLDFSNSKSSFNSFDGTKKLRSLLIWGSRSRRSSLTTEGLSRLFCELTHIRSLSLRYGYFAEIPSSISKLVHLRWLDLSYNDELMRLPETLCELHNLQTIDVTGCHALELPLGIGNLINLRHLPNFYAYISFPRKEFPKGIGRLTGLRTLEVVDVGSDGADAFSLGDLKNLNQLRGELNIINLGACHRHVAEAKEAELKKKEHITNLTLKFQFRIEAGVREEEVEEEHLLEALEPYPSLETLKIEDYRGVAFPAWIISLTNLQDVKLSSCQSCEHLPSLGKLPSLETLTLYQMKGVKNVGVELLGIETQIGDTKSKSEVSASSSSSPFASSSSVVVAFPKLTKLEFGHMDSWEEWDDYYDGTTNPPPAIKIMPSLRSLTTDYCPKLKALPDYILQNTLLHTLDIRGSHLLRQRYKFGEDSSKISHISNVKIWY